jgi:hypothetical protein
MHPVTAGHRKPDCISFLNILGMGWEQHNFSFLGLSSPTIRLVWVLDHMDIVSWVLFGDLRCQVATYVLSNANRVLGYRKL